MDTTCTVGELPVTPPATSMARIELAIDQDGDLYTAEVFGGRLQKFRPKPNADPAKLIGQEVRCPHLVDQLRLRGSSDLWGPRRKSDELGGLASTSPEGVGAQSAVPGPHVDRNRRRNLRIPHQCQRERHRFPSGASPGLSPGRRRSLPTPACRCPRMR